MGCGKSPNDHAVRCRNLGRSPLKARGYDAKFIATGQTGIMIEGDGCPVDCVVSDFVNGAIEKQILANQHHDVLVIEGQGAISHPRYSAVTLGLLHGCVPHGLILVYEAGRHTVLGMDYVLTFIHELGHAVVLVHHGRKVKSAGFMIYFGSPVFFVESSEVLMLDRKERIVQAFADQDFSFTDCTSFVIMRERGVRDADEERFRA
jgi:hypothetical protein